MISRTLSTSQCYEALYARAGRLAEFCQVLYPLIIVHSDDFGRLQGDVFTVKLEVLPISKRKLPDFQEALEALHDVGLIRWYEVDGRKYIQVNQFEAHQVNLHKRTRSKFPEAPQNFKKFREFPIQEKRTEEKRTEGKGTGCTGEIARDPWTCLMGELRGVLSEQSLEMWLKPCVFLEEHEDRIRVAVPTTFALDWLSKHFASAIRETADRVLPGKRIEFVLQAKAAS